MSVLVVNGETGDQRVREIRDEQMLAEGRVSVDQLRVARMVQLVHLLREMRHADSENFAGTGTLRVELLECKGVHGKHVRCWW